MSTETTLLIVNADDLGRSAGINRGIFAAHAGGIVTSATLMVGFPDAEPAAAAWADHPGLGIGLHVTLTGGAPPTLPAGRVPSLVDSAGRLPRKPDGLGGARPDDVLAEVRHQLERFRELTGRLPTHLDSHHHSHRLPVVLEALIEVAREHRLPVRGAAPEVRRRLREAAVVTTDLFEERFFGEAVSLDVLRDVVRSAANARVRSVELMCHPGRSDEALRSSSSYADARERELEVLTDPAARLAIDSAGLRLGHFGDLREAAA